MANIDYNHLDAELVSRLNNIVLFFGQNQHKDAASVLKLLFDKNSFKQFLQEDEKANQSLELSKQDKQAIKIARGNLKTLHSLINGKQESINRIMERNDLKSAQLQEIAEYAKLNVASLIKQLEQEDS